MDPKDKENGNEDKGTGGGNGSGGAGASQEEKLRSLLARHDNDWAALAGQLFSENYSLREERRKLRADLANKVPEGSVIVSKDEADRLEAFKALGEPSDLSKRLQELSQLRREAQIQDLATHHKLKAGALKLVLKDGAEIVAEGEGEAKTFSIKTGDKATPVKELLEGEWKDLAPALTDSGPARKVLGQAGAGAPPEDDPVAAYLAAQSRGANQSEKE